MEAIEALGCPCLFAPAYSHRVYIAEDDRLEWPMVAR